MSQAVDFLVLVVLGRVKVAVRLWPRNAEETVTNADFADCVALQTELKRLKLRKNNWNSDTYEFDEVFTESASQKRVYEVVAKLVVEVYYGCTVSLSSSSNAGSEYLQAECLKVPASSFMSSLKTTVDAIQQVVPVVSKFANVFGDFCLTNAISDCLDLLDFSADELSWSISASQNPADLFAGLVWNVAGYVAGIRVLLDDGGLLGMGWSVAECLHWSVGMWLLEYSH